MRTPKTLAQPAVVGLILVGTCLLPAAERAGRHWDLLVAADPAE